MAEQLYPGAALREKFRGSWRVWRHRWALLGLVGVSEERWQKWPVIVRRAFIAGVIGLLALVVITPLSGFDISAFGAYLVFVAMYVPEWRRLGRYGKYVIPLAFLAIVAGYPEYGFNSDGTGKLFTIPILGAFPSVHTAVVMLIFVMMAAGLNIVVGYAGLLDLGYVAFYAIGAYTAAILASTQFAGSNAQGNPTHFFNLGGVGIDKTLGGIHISIWLLLVIAGLLCALAGVIIGAPTLRLRSDYLALVTLGFGEIIYEVFYNGDDLFGVNVSNGNRGINPVDPPGFGSWLSDKLGLPANVIVENGEYVNFVSLIYWTAICLVLLTIFFSLRLRDSKLGRAWIAIREDETAAAAMGIPLMRTKTLAYAMGAFVAGVAGAFFAEVNTGANPDAFAFQFSVAVLVMVILGGVGNVWGVLVGAAFLAYLDQQGLADTGAWLNQHLHISIDVPEYEYGIFGVFLLLVMLFRPHGLIPEARHKLEFEEGVADEPLYDVTA